MLVLTFANKHEPMLSNLCSSLQKNDYRYEVLGLGMTWKNFMTKIQTCWDRVSKLPRREVVAIVDAYDVFANKPANVTLSRFKSYGADLVVGCERYCGINCHPLNDWRKESLTKQKYVNGGFYMGYAFAVEEALRCILSTGLEDDQVALGMYVNENEGRVALDQDSSLVKNIGPRNMFDSWQDSCFVHCPSREADLMYRCDKIGRAILGEEYVKTPLLTSGKGLASRMKKSVKKVHVYTFLALILLVLILAFFLI